MASIFKRKRDGSKRNATWWIEYTDENGYRRRKKGFSDRRLTEQLAAEIEDKVRLKNSNLIDPVLEALATHRTAPVKVHLDAYETHLTGGTKTKKHRTLTMSRLRSIVSECDFKCLADIRIESVNDFVQSLYEGGLAARTANHYAQAASGWGNWLVKTNRLAANPLQGLTIYNAEADIRHKRRALSIAEVGQLIESARTSGVKIQSYSPLLRALLYLVSFLTGLRRKELASLTAKSFDLHSDQPTVTVTAACSKHRRTDVLPLHPDLVAVLPEWLDALLPNAFLFPSLANKKTWLMVKKDLERVGIDYETAEGIADFHASGRHTYITELFRNGASIVEARKLARHTDVKMTMRYTHVGLAEQAKALAALPRPHSPSDAGQHSGRSASRRQCPGESQHDVPWQKSEPDGKNGSRDEQQLSDDSWRKKTGDGNRSHLSPVSGGGGNRTFGGFRRKRKQGMRLRELPTVPRCKCAAF